MKKYTSFKEYLQNLFSCRVYKISIDANFSCPNRDGTKGNGGCIYCDKYGSSSRSHAENISIKEQILKNIEVRKSRYKAQKFICYFQSFSNTYSDVKTLKGLYDEAIFSHPDIVGISISTRADCLDEDKIKLIASYRKYLPFVSIEIGMQTIHDKTLTLINRGETHFDFIKAYSIIKKYPIHLCIHVILGLPNETKKDIFKTAKYLSSLKIHGVKLHLLVALKNTALANMYKQKKWNPLKINEYIGLCSDFIKFLPKNCIIHRTVGSGHPKDIVAPKWVYEKKSKIIQSIIKAL